MITDDSCDPDRPRTVRQSTTRFNCLPQMSLRESGALSVALSALSEWSVCKISMCVQVMFDVMKSKK